MMATITMETKHIANTSLPRNKSNGALSTLATSLGLSRDEEVVVADTVKNPFACKPTRTEDVLGKTNAMVNDDELWRAFKAELATSGVKTGMGIKIVHNKFMSKMEKSTAPPVKRVRSTPALVSLGSEVSPNTSAEPSAVPHRRVVKRANSFYGGGGQFVRRLSKASIGSISSVASLTKEVKDGMSSMVSLESEVKDKPTVVNKTAMPADLAAGHESVSSIELATRGASRRSSTASTRSMSSQRLAEAHAQARRRNSSSLKNRRTSGSSRQTPTASPRGSFASSSEMAKAALIVSAMDLDDMSDDDDEESAYYESMHRSWSHDPRPPAEADSNRPDFTRSLSDAERPTRGVQGIPTFDPPQARTRAQRRASAKVALSTGCLSCDETIIEESECGSKDSYDRAEDLESKLSGLSMEDFGDLDCGNDEVYEANKGKDSYDHGEDIESNVSGLSGEDFGDLGSDEDDDAEEYHQSGECIVLWPESR